MNINLADTGGVFRVDKSFFDSTNYSNTVRTSDIDKVDKSWRDLTHTILTKINIDI